MSYGKSVGGLIAAALVAAGVAAPPAVAKDVIKMANWVPAQGTATRGFMEPWAKMLEKEAAPDLTIQRYWGGSLGRNPAKQFDLVRDGVVDIGWHFCGYTPGLFPQVALMELPLIAHNAVEASATLWRLYEKGMLDGFEDVKLLGIHTIEEYGIHARKPIRSFDDLKGLKISTSGPVQAEFLKLYGAVPIGMPMTQVVESMQRGTIDGAYVGWNGVRTFRMMDIARYHFAPPLGVGPVAVVMNKKKWDSLSPPVRKAFEKYNGEKLSRMGGEAFDKGGVVMRRVLEKDPKHAVVVPSQADIDAAFTKLGPMRAQVIAKTPKGRQVYETMLKVLADVRAGK